MPRQDPPTEQQERPTLNRDLTVLDERGKVVIRRYGDGRPAVVQGGATVRYTAGGKPVIINRGGDW